MKRTGEFDLISQFVKRIHQRKKSVLLGSGDDAAVIRPSKDILASADMLVEGTHFRRDWMTPEEIGFKAIRVNVSDISAMGGRPEWALITLGFSGKDKSRDILRLFNGMNRALDESGIQLIGGDMNRSDRWIVHVTIMGIPFMDPLTRSGARAGDNIYVTGSLGHSALGLEALKKSGKEKGLLPFIKAHKTAPMRTHVAKWLSAEKGIHSLIDVSDGLIGDLRHVLEQSGVGATIDLETLPMDSDFREACRLLKKDPYDVLLSGGEDYELLFTASPQAKIPSRVGSVPISKIGRILPRVKGFFLTLGSRELPIRKYSFDHFLPP